MKAGKAPRLKQDESKATYEGRATADIARIDWGKSWRQIDPLVRGCNPAPGAWTTLDGKNLQIFDVTPMPAKDPKGIGGKYGEIVAVEADGFTVVCPDGRIKVTRVKPADGPKVGAGEFGAAARASPSARGWSERHDALILRASAGARSSEGNDSFERPHRALRKGEMNSEERKYSMPASQHTNPKTDIQIAQEARKRPIMELAKEKLGIAPRTSIPTATTRPRSRWTTSSRCRASPTAS